LTYVAMTRARRRLFLLLPPVAPAASAAATMRRLLPEVGSQVGVVVEDAMSYLLASPRALANEKIPSPEPRTTAAPSMAGRESLTISTTALATFEQCPRRYRLIHELALDPPSVPARPPAERDVHPREAGRALGSAAHRVLQHWP